MRTEDLILNNLINNEEFARKTIPFIKEEYFNEFTDRILFGLICKYSEKYKDFPTKNILQMELQKLDTLNEDQYNELTKKISNLTHSDKDQQEWLINETEMFCKDKAMYNAIMQSIKILEEKENNISKGAIPQIVTDALAISFDKSVGHDLLNDYNKRYDEYHAIHKRLPFDLDYMNRITKGGLFKKTLTVLLAGTGVGKTLCMCHFAANNLLNGLNVLYITLEVSEIEISKRIDANILNVTMNDLENMPYSVYSSRMEEIKGKTSGRLVIKEYPTSSASVANFRFLLNELKLKQKFIPDVIYIDYLNICACARIKNGPNVNSYTYNKTIAEELRGLGVEFDVPVITATQLNRSGFTNSDPGLEDTAESFGVPATADLMFALISNEVLEQMNQILVKQLKNRYNDPTIYRTFVLGIDRARMRLYDLDESAQKGLTQDTPVMDNTEVGERIDEEQPRPRLKKRNKFDVNKLKEFK